MDSESQLSLLQWELTDDQGEETRIMYTVMNDVEDISNKSYLT